MSQFTPRETLSDVALRAFRSPVSGLATMLAVIVSEVDATIAAAYLVPDTSEPVELLAAAGQYAATLGPPGRTGPNVALAVREASRTSATSQTSAKMSGVAPWSLHPNVISTSILLDGSSSCLLTVASSESIGLDRLYASSASIGLLAQMTLHRREIERLRQELHDLQQDRSLLTAGLHHDLKGPLTSILGSARTLMVRDDELDSDTRTNLLASVATQAERLSRMLNETLERQASDPNAPVRKMNVKLKDLSERVAAAAVAGRTGQVVVESPTDLSITTDGDRLERALLNLVDNALKYSPEEVPVHVIVEEDGDHVTLTVADNGSGVSSDVLPGLFSAYATDPGRTDGTGLGLHSVRSLVEELGGRVGYSRHSEWTRFTISLPRGEGR